MFHLVAQIWLDLMHVVLVGSVFWFRSNFGRIWMYREKGMNSNQKLKGVTDKMKPDKLRDPLSLSWIFYQINLEKSPFNPFYN